MRVEHTELEEPTFRRFTNTEGERSWVCQTLDYATVGYDPILFANWQVAARVRNDHARASDHKATEIAFEKGDGRA